MEDNMQIRKEFFVPKKINKKRGGRAKNYLILILAAALIFTLAKPYIDDAGITGSVTGLFIDDYTNQQGFNEDGSPYLGSNHAPVKIEIFSDFQCPYCTRLAEGAMPSIIENYVKTGKVQLVFKQFPLSFHDQAEGAAMASMCAGKQGKFWEYHDGLFANQDKLSETYFKSLAKELNLDETKFDTCMRSKEFLGQIVLDKQAASEVGIKGTPASVINGEIVTGAQPYNSFKVIIDQKLAE
ncbi:DsbA family protein [Nanoarchaeota archaeon]